MQYHLTDIPVLETLRYALGEKVPEPVPDELLLHAQEACRDILSGCSPLYHYIIHPVQPLLDSFLAGEDIHRHLDGCESCILLCATLGPQADSLIRRAQVSSMAKALWLDAAASAAIEEVCDGVQRGIAEQLSQSLTTRFSCGYGDLPLETQRHFLNLLDSGHRIGLTLSPSGMMIPIKSVTAVIGILPEGIHPRHKEAPCERCQLRENCRLRRKGVFCGKYSD